MTKNVKLIKGVIALLALSIVILIFIITLNS